MVEVIGTEKFKNEIFDLEKDEPLPGIRPTLVNFFATWCGPCAHFAPILDQLAEEYAGRVDIFKMDIEESPEVPKEFTILSVPHTLFVCPGKDTVLVAGGTSIEKMRQAILEIFAIS
jgi:thioredoxin-like negative regulator of GroEL